MSAHNRKTPACGAFRGPAVEAVKKYYFLTKRFAA